MSLNVAYFGSPDFSARFLEKILRDEHIPGSITLVLTQPDRPVGRSQEITPSAVKKIALEHGIEVIHEVTPEILKTKNIDLGLVFAYGRIIPEELLAIPQYGIWNIHPSLLPLYRGASPVAYALMVGEDLTGCSLMKMDAKLDHGPIIDEERLRITRDDTNTTLLEKLAYVGYYLYKKNITLLSEGRLDLSSLAVQNNSMATFTRLLNRDDGKIECDLFKKALNKEKIVTDEFPQILRDYLGQNTITEFPIPYAPYIVYNMYRALHPWPGIWTTVTIDRLEKRLKILDASLQDNKLQISTVQLEGKSPVSFDQFKAAYQVF